MTRGGKELKAPLTKHYCIGKECGWEETNHKYMDGCNCLKCGLPIISEIVNKNDTPRQKLW